MLPNELNTEETRQNIRNLFQSAHPEEVNQGLCWYYDAHLVAQACADKLHWEPYDVALDVASAVIATLSPMNEWGMNVADAQWLVEHYQDIEIAEQDNYTSDQAWRRSVGYDVQIKAEMEGHSQGQQYAENWGKALLILRTGQIPEFCRGPKVTRFYRNIRSPESSVDVTIDRHAINALVGRTTDDSERSTLRGMRYETAVAAYLKVAEELGLRPWQLQAVVWCAQKNRFGFQPQLPF